MNIFTKLKDRLFKGSEQIKAKIKKPDLAGHETTTEADDLTKAFQKAHQTTQQQNPGGGFKQLMKDLKGSSNKGKTLLGFVAGRLSKGNQKPEVFEGITAEQLRRGKEIREIYEKTKDASREFEFRKKTFQKTQFERNMAIIELKGQLEDWEKEIADDNGLLEMDHVPFELLLSEPEMLKDRLLEYVEIIEDAEKFIREKLVKGYDDFLNMIIHTIIPDMNEGFIEELKEAFKYASLQEKSAFLEEWWKEMRELYDDLKSGSETLWGLEIQQTVAEAMLESIRTGSYEKTWDSSKAKSHDPEVAAENYRKYVNRKAKNY